MERYAGLSRREIKAGPTWNNNHDADLLQTEEEVFGPPLEQGRELYVEDLGHFENNDKAENRQKQHDHMKGRDDSRGI